MPRRDVRLLDPADNFNEQIQDRVIRHMLFLEGVKTRQVNEVLAFVDNEILPDLISQLEARLARGGSLGPQTIQRLEGTIAELSAVTTRFRDINTRIQGELFTLATDEQTWQLGVLNETAGTDLNLNTIAPAQLVATITATPYDGRTLDNWWSGLARSAQERLNVEIRRGIIEGETSAQIVRRIRTGGYLDTTRRQTEAVVRTTVAHYANEARNQFFKANSDVIRGVQWLATLDSRTCLTCSPLDGQVFELDKGPRPPLHANCRCTVTPVTKSASAFQADLSESTRSSIDGQVAGDTTYNQWLRKQPIDVQEMALGRTKAKLFRDGGLDVQQFTNRNRVELTLDQLRQREAGAFAAAGL